MLQMDYQPEGQGDLDRFKEFTEAQWRETGAWRGEIKRQP
jgi:hypothetical protein